MTCRRGGTGGVCCERPDGDTTVAGDAFTRCEGLAQVTLPATEATIANGRHDFDDRESEADDEDEVEDGAYLGCTSLPEITLPLNPTEIRM